MEFQIHKDDYVVLIDGVGNVVYQDSVKNFSADSGLSLVLPAGMVAMICADDVTVYYDAKQNAHPVAGAYCPDMVTRALSLAAEIADAKIVRVRKAELAAVAEAVRLAQSKLSAAAAVSL